MLVAHFPILTAIFKVVKCRAQVFWTISALFQPLKFGDFRLKVSVMRIDKFLKVSRVIKRRTVAQEACDGGRIEINGKAVKPAKEVKVGDVVAVSFGNNTLRFEVLSVDEKQTKQSAETMYRIIE